MKKRGEYLSFDFVTNTEAGERTERKLYKVLEDCEVKDIITLAKALTDGKIKQESYNGG